MIHPFPRPCLITLILWLTISLVKAQQTSPYSVNWVNNTGVSIDNGVLTKTAPTGSWYNGGAISSNLLLSNTDGWMEFTAVNGADYMVGLGANNKINYNEFTHSIHIDDNTNTAIVHELGASGISLGSFQTGDVFRISREGNVMNYYKNGVVVRSVNVSAASDLKIKACIQVNGKSTPVIITSFDSQLILRATITNADGDSGMGSISVNVSGGTSPYTYSWSSGEQTNTVSSKAQGSYTLAVTDALGREKTHTYAIGYRVNWINQVGVNTNGETLTRTVTPGNWSASGAVSSNLLPSNTDGWMEFVVVSGADYMVGWGTNNLNNYSEFTQTIHIDDDTNTAISREGDANGISLGTFQTGDVFRISREGNVGKYYKNGIVLRTVNVSSDKELKIKGTIQLLGMTIPAVSTSFDCKLVVRGNVTGLDGNSGTGSILINAFGGTSPYTYNWSSGEASSAISNKPKGTYTVTVTDALGREQLRTYNIGYNVNWINQMGVSSSGGILTKTINGDWSTAGAVSSNILPANTDGWIEFTGVNSADYRIGFAVNNDINYSAFTHGFYVDDNFGAANACEGASSVWLGNFQTGDVLKISREGNLIKYFRNGIVLRTVSVNPSLVLKIKTSLYNKGASTPNINASFWSTDGIIRTYYSIASGNWTSPSIWSLSENGPPSTVYPDDIDKVVIKGHEVTVSSLIKSAGITITSTNDETRLKVDGGMAALEVKGNIVMNRENNSNTAEVLVVANNGRLDIK